MLASNMNVHEDGTSTHNVIKPIDRSTLREQVRNATPFPNFCIDNFLDPAFAEEVHASFPSFEEAARMGRSFGAVNERGKIQVTDSTKFPTPIRRLHEALASREWLDLLSEVINIPNLLPDEELQGGGIHETGPRGHLDVHVDFNYIKERQLHRRLNILVYFNKNWQEDWGGAIELWDKDVKVCHHSYLPIFNRCVVFETSDISYHGVTAVRCPEGQSRKSFAAYYYTIEAPAHWTGVAHSTIFKARPNELMKGMVLMPTEKLARSFRKTIRRLKSSMKPNR
ncbi:MAG: 2OG-Fe(II) oxygenase [Phycisphaeraceae bacterium]|nr:MAG: 2OG-Fe(II) oxygenase [Phycisphaeraceae bacterium]